VLVASGSEVGVAVQAAGILEAVVSVRVVSIPGKNYYSAGASVQEQIIPSSARVVVVEAARGMAGAICSPTASCSWDRAFRRFRS